MPVASFDMISIHMPGRTSSSSSTSDYSSASDLDFDDDEDYSMVTTAPFSSQKPCSTRQTNATFSCHRPTSNVPADLSAALLTVRIALASLDRAVDIVPSFFVA
jgi:hypothetical protein